VFLRFQFFDTNLDEPGKKQITNFTQGQKWTSETKADTLRITAGPA